MRKKKLLFFVDQDLFLVCIPHALHLHSPTSFHKSNYSVSAFFCGIWGQMYPKLNKKKFIIIHLFKISIKNFKFLNI